MFTIPSILAPSPPDAGRYTVPSRFGCQSGDCGYRVRGHLTARYLAAVPRRILLMEQQVWSILHARQSTLRPRVAVPSPHGAFQEHAAHTLEWSKVLRSKGSLGTCIPKVFPHSSMPLHGTPSGGYSQSAANPCSARLLPLLQRPLAPNNRTASARRSTGKGTAGISRFIAYADYAAEMPLPCDVFRCSCPSFW